MTKKQHQKKKITVTIRSTASVIDEVLNTCRKLQQGLPVAEAETELTFNDAATMLSTLSEKRLELLTFLRKYGSITIKELSRQLKRNYSNVHEDVQLLLRLGLLNKDEFDKIYVPWDELNISLPLAA
jgi:predicted transcriptional regulator